MDYFHFSLFVRFFDKFPYILQQSDFAGNTSLGKPYSTCACVEGSHVLEALLME